MAWAVTGAARDTVSARASEAAVREKFFLMPDRIRIFYRFCLQVRLGYYRTPAYKCTTAALMQLVSYE